MNGTLLKNNLYPKKLLVLKNPPKQLYFLGNRDLLSENILGIVGPRKMSVYCKSVIDLLCRSISNCRGVTVSGGAEGVDESIHQLSFDSALKTIVVLGMGIDCALRSARGGFYKKLLDYGCLLLSEYDNLTPGAPWRFPERNRIVAALGSAIIVPGCGVGSGTRYTVEYALQCGVPVYCVPGSILEESSALSNKRLAQGVAKPIVDFEEIFMRYGFTKNTSQDYEIKLSKDQQLLLYFCRSLQSLEAITQGLGRSIEKVLEQVGELEFAGHIMQPMSGSYITHQSVIQLLAV